MLRCVLQHPQWRVRVVSRRTDINEEISSHAGVPDALFKHQLAITKKTSNNNKLNMMSSS
eukprot:4787153-Prorocentrum_lima.AAC.1